MTAPDDSAARAEFLLTALRGVSAKAGLFQNDVNEIGIALKYGMVTPDFALEWARDVGALDHMQAAERKILTDEGSAS